MKNIKNILRELEKDQQKKIEAIALFLNLNLAERIIIGYLIRGYRIEEIAVETYSTPQEIELIENSILKKLCLKDKNEIYTLANILGMI